jgi:hypothetical protein
MGARIPMTASLSELSENLKPALRTYLKLFGGDINNFMSLNASLVNVGILLKISERLDEIENRLESSKI